MARAHKRKKTTTERAFDPTRWAHATFMLGAFLVMLIGAYLIEDVWSVVWSRWPQAVMRPQSLYANIAGVVLGLGVGFWGWRQERYFKFICEVAIEVSQVVWPTRAEVRAATMVVIVITAICSVLLFAMDQFWLLTTNFLYGL